jgi:hypothetical protein
MRNRDSEPAAAATASRYPQRVPIRAAVALGQPRPVVLPTSDPVEMARLTDEPSRPRSERIAVVRV